MADASVNLTTHMAALRPTFSIIARRFEPRSGCDFCYLVTGHSPCLACVRYPLDLFQYHQLCRPSSRFTDNFSPTPSPPQHVATIPPPRPMALPPLARYLLRNQQCRPPKGPPTAQAHRRRRSLQATPTHIDHPRAERQLRPTNFSPRSTYSSTSTSEPQTSSPSSTW